MSDIFISYAREDAEKTGVLARLLKGSGLSVWFDDGIPAGEDYEAVIRRELAQSRCVIVLWSSYSINSLWVKAEATEGLNARKLLPVAVDADTRPPLPFTQLETRTIADWTGRRGSGIGQVIVDVKRLLQVTTESRAAPIPVERRVPIPLFGRAFDLRPDRDDPRDRRLGQIPSQLPATVPARERLTARIDKFMAAGLVTDQGREGACAAFGLANVINMLWCQRNSGSRHRRRLASVSLGMLWHFALLYEGREADDYGVSCRSALRGWSRYGVCVERLWPYRSGSRLEKAGKPPDPPLEGWEEDAARRPLAAYYKLNSKSIAEIQMALAHVGAVYASATVHGGWSELSTTLTSGGLPVITTPARLGKVAGHAFAMVGYTQLGFVVLNSWGLDWGRKGFAILPYAEWLARGMSVWLAVPGVAIDTTHVVVMGKKRTTRPTRRRGSSR